MADYKISFQKILSASKFQTFPMRSKINEYVWSIAYDCENRRSKTTYTQPTKTRNSNCAEWKIVQ